MNLKTSYLKTILKENIILIILLLICIIFQPFLSVLVARFIEKIINNIYATNSIFSSTIIITLVIIIISFLLSWVCKNIGSILVQKTSIKIKEDALNNISTISYDEFEMQDIGDINAIMVNDIENASQIIKMYSSAFLMPVIESVFIFIYLLLVDWKISLVLFAGIIIMNIISKYTSPVIQDKSYNINKNKGVLNNILIKIFDTLDITKIFSCHHFIEKQYFTVRNKIYREKFKLEFKLINLELALNITSFIITNLTIIFLAYNIIINNSGLGQIFLYIILIEKCMTSSNYAFNTYGWFSKINGSWKRIEYFFNLKSEMKDNNYNMSISSINLKNIDFYRDSLPILNNFSITLDKGKIYCVKGESGSGKSTLLKIIAGLYRIDIGEYLINGNINNISDFSMSYVTAMPKLFDLTLYENLILENLTANKEDVIYMSKVMGADDWIASLEVGYDTVLNSSGDSLSGGQKQMIAIMRALISNRQIIIMDEPFSNLDVQSQIRLYDYLNEIKSEKIIIFSSHKESTFKYCDEMVEIQKIIE